MRSVLKWLRACPQVASRIWFALLLYCTSTVPILFQHCTSNASVLFQHSSHSAPLLLTYCTSSAPTLFQYCSNTVAVLFQCCSNTVSVLFECCCSAAPELLHYCFSAVSILFLYCTSIAPVLFQCCSNTVPVLHQGSTTPVAAPLLFQYYSSIVAAAKLKTKLLFHSVRRNEICSEMAVRMPASGFAHLELLTLVLHQYCSNTPALHQ